MYLNMHNYIKVYNVFFFSCFHNYVSKNALLDMRYFLIFGHISMYKKKIMADYSRST